MKIIKRAISHPKEVGWLRRATSLNFDSCLVRSYNKEWQTMSHKLWGKPSVATSMAFAFVYGASVRGRFYVPPRTPRI